MNIILANAPTKNGNRGCVALSISIMCILDEILTERQIPYNFYLPDSGHQSTDEHKIKIGEREISYKTCQNITFYNLRKIAICLSKPKQYIASLRIYRNADCIMDIGQGDSFADIYGIARFKQIFSEYQLGKRFNLPYCILPQTIGPFTHPGIRKKAVAGIKRTKMLMVRDRQSYDYVKELMPQKDVAECIDVAFFMPYKRKIFNDDHIHVGLNISALLWNGGYTRDNQFGLKADYQHLIKNIIEHFLSIENVKLHLVPHVVAAERQIENDYAISYKLYEEYADDRLILAPLFLDPMIAKGYIAGMDFFMGARMHATIAAFSSGVPVYPMAYSRKFNGLFADTLTYKHMGDMKAQDSLTILQGIAEAYEHRSDLKDIIGNRMSTVVEERRRLLVECLTRFMKI